VVPGLIWYGLLVGSTRDPAMATEGRGRVQWSCKNPHRLARVSIGRDPPRRIWRDKTLAANRSSHGPISHLCTRLPG
jgi:hypothetical protein